MAIVDVLSKQAETELIATLRSIQATMISLRVVTDEMSMIMRKIREEGILIRPASKEK